MTKVDLDAQANLREQILFGMVVLFVVILFFRIIYKGQGQRVEILRGRIEALQVEKEALIQFSEGMPRVARETLLSERRGIKFKILAGQVRSSYDDLSALLKEITAPQFLGTVQVENLSTLPAVLDQGFLKTDFTIDVRGSFADLLQYLERVEQFPAVAILENISLKSAEGQPQDVQAEILGRFFQIKTTGAVRQQGP